ncbi:MAG: hypothetical protein ACRCYS_10590, partial [Beijerinckiaceae bacterium]
KGVDFLYDDRFLDPYFDQRRTGAATFSGLPYVPEGMFFERLRARDPFFAGYAMRIKHGRMVNGALVTDRTTHYIMTEFDPAGGKVEWQGVDVLDLAANDRALVPRPSQGRVSAAVIVGQTSITLVPAGIGVEYGASGWVTIGKEIMSFTRVGDVLTVVRGRFRTLDQAHQADASVQEAYRFVGKAHNAVIDMLTNFASVPATWIPTAEWQAEADVWFSVDLDTIITKPIPVGNAIAELAILGFSLFTDLEAQKIRFRPNRPLLPAEKSTAPSITDNDIVGKLEYDGRDSERLTRVEFRSVQIDPTSELSDDNFEQRYVTISGDSEDPRAYGDVRYRLEKTRWLNQGADALVRILANRYIRRFTTPPERVEITVKRRKYGALALASVVRLTSRHIPSPHGLVEARLFQVIKRDAINAGELRLTLQRFEYDGNFGFWAANGAPQYSAATEDQKDAMAFWGPNTGDTFADGRNLYEWS